MQPVQATGRRRASSCPGMLTPDLKDLELRTTGATAHARSQAFTDTTATLIRPWPPSLDYLPRSVIQDSKALPSTAGVQSQNFEDLTNTRRQEESPAEGHLSKHLPIYSVQPETRPSVEKQRTACQESLTEISVEIPPVNSHAGLSLQPTTAGRKATPGQEHSSHPTSEVSRADTPIKLESGPFELEKVTTTPNQDDFLKKYKPLLPSSDWDEFASIITRERVSKANLLCLEQVPKYHTWKPSMVSGLDRSSHEVLLIEEVDLWWLMALDAKFDLDPAFVLSYAGFPPEGGKSGGDYVPHDECRKVDIGMDGVAGSWYKMAGKMDGIWEHGEISPTECPWYRESRRSRLGRTSVMACYCLSDTLRVIFVESPPRVAERIDYPFQIDVEYGGYAILSVSLGQMAFHRPFSVFEHLVQSYEKWRETHDDDDDDESLAFKNLALLGKQASPDSKALMHKVAFSMWSLNAYQWRANLRYLQDIFRDRRRNALMQPSMRTYLPLIYLRQVIVGMRDYANKITHDTIVDTAFEQNRRHDPSVRPSGLVKILGQITEDLNKLDKELNDEIHLIIGAVTVQDSDATKQQAERATLLTVLAAIYLPMTLVTGIFGMNIKGIEDGGVLGWRACSVVLAVVAVCTGVFVVAYRRWRCWQKGRRERQNEFDKYV